MITKTMVVMIAMVISALIGLVFFMRGNSMELPLSDKDRKTQVGFYGCAFCFSLPLIAGLILLLISTFIQIWNSLPN